jgi:predicted transposase/invertase (TIGR01784 family)
VNALTPDPLPTRLVPRGFVPPRSDLLFKKIFSDQHNTDLLVDLLRSVVDLPDADWTRLALPDTHTLADWADDKTAVLDVKVTTATGRVVDIEIQLCPTPDLPQRLVFYSASMVTSQMVRGAAYDTIHQTICILLADFVMFDDPHRHHRFVYHDPDHHLTLTDLTMIHTLELPKLTEVDDGTVEWQWLRFIAARTPEEMTMAATSNPQVARAATLVERYNADEQFRYELEAHERFLHDQASHRLAAERAGFAQGLAEGQAEGHAEGLAEGHAEGHAEGRADGVVSVARNALAMGLPVEAVSTLTGLSATEVARLAQEATDGSGATEPPEG